MQAGLRACIQTTVFLLFLGAEGLRSIFNCFLTANDPGPVATRASFTKAVCLLFMSKFCTSEGLMQGLSLLDKRLVLPLLDITRKEVPHHRQLTTSHFSARVMTGLPSRLSLQHCKSTSISCRNQLDGAHCVQPVGPIRKLRFSRCSQRLDTCCTQAGAGTT